jgi:hypothetical protein
LGARNFPVVFTELLLKPGKEFSVGRGESAAFKPQGAFNMLKQLMVMTKAAHPFDPSFIGARSNTPVYRHVEKDQYNCFSVLFNLASDQPIINGAGGAKDEALGEVDGVRPT